MNDGSVKVSKQRDEQEEGNGSKAVHTRIGMNLFASTLTLTKEEHKKDGSKRDSSNKRKSTKPRNRQHPPKMIQPKIQIGRAVDVRPPQPTNAATAMMAILPPETNGSPFAPPVGKPYPRIIIISTKKQKKKRSEPKGFLAIPLAGYSDVEDAKKRARKQRLRYMAEAFQLLADEHSTEKYASFASSYVTSMRQQQQNTPRHTSRYSSQASKMYSLARSDSEEKLLLKQMNCLSIATPHEIRNSYKSPLMVEPTL